MSYIKNNVRLVYSLAYISFIYMFIVCCIAVLL